MTRGTDDDGRPIRYTAWRTEREVIVTRDHYREQPEPTGRGVARYKLANDNPQPAEPLAAHGWRKLGIWSTYFGSHRIDGEIPWAWCAVAPPEDHQDEP